MIVRAVCGTAVLELSRPEADILTVWGLKGRLRALHGWDIFRQCLVTQTGNLLHDWDLLPLAAHGELSELTLIVNEEHPAVVALDDVIFSRTRREHEGQPIYHGHSET